MTRATRATSVRPRSLVMLAPPERHERSWQRAAARAARGVRLATREGSSRRAARPRQTASGMHVEAGRAVRRCCSMLATPTKRVTAAAEAPRSAIVASRPPRDAHPWTTHLRAATGARRMAWAIAAETTVATAWERVATHTHRAAASNFLPAALAMSGAPLASGCRVAPVRTTRSASAAPRCQAGCAAYPRPC